MSITATLTTSDREFVPADERDLCAWCNATATRNLHTFHDVCCDAHFEQWFAGPDAAPACDCRDCLDTPARRDRAAQRAWLRSQPDENPFA
jgi:hypothetical protein